MSVELDRMVAAIVDLPVLPYSTNAGAAIRAVKKLISEGYNFTMISVGEKWVVYTDIGQPIENIPGILMNEFYFKPEYAKDTLAEAICYAIVYGGKDE